MMPLPKEQAGNKKRLLTDSGSLAFIQVIENEERSVVKAVLHRLFRVQ
ncbi:hypothetical protein [Paenibacillus sp. LjRoot56]